MAKIIIAVLSCICICLVSSTSGSDQNNVLEHLKNKAEYENIGQLGKKMFIKHNNSTLNWMAAREICREAGLELAALNNREEFSFVSGALIGTQTSAWVSGIMDGVQQYQYPGFVWDSDGTQVGNDINFMVLPYYWLCLYYSGDDHIYVDSCLSGQHETLCQKVLP